MVLICDVCHTEISVNNNEDSPPSINLFPCFHKHCDRCKCTSYQPNGRVACKVCGCQCLPKHVYDYVEPQLDRIYCMFCNIKNRAQVEWRCDTCQKSYLCNVCTKPHFVSGHTLTPVRTYVPSHSQCHGHLNLAATYLCSCQTRLCVHCLNVHANGQLVAPHEQRYPFAQLADQARQRIQVIRTNSQREIDKANKILPVLQRNKKFVHEMASKARSAVANQIVELCNTLIRRGNDIVTHIDLFEQEKLQKYELVGNELKRVVDHFKKIEEFSENALVTAQNDHPGMYSASEFAQSSVNLISKKLDTLQKDIELTQRLPKINYQSDLTSLVHSIQNLGLVDVDGHKTVPMLTTPQNAQMFTVSGCSTIPQSHPATSAVASATTTRPSLTSSLNSSTGASIRHGPTMIQPNPNLGHSMVASGSISAVPTNPFNVPLPPNVGIVQPTQQQQHLVNNGRIMSSPHPQLPPVHLIPTSTPVTGVLSHLLQQGVHTTVPNANNSLPTTPTTPSFPHIRQPHPQAVTVHQHPFIQQQQQQQHTLALQQQQIAQMQRQQAVRNQMVCQQQLQQQHLFQQQQQQQQQQLHYSHHQLQHHQNSTSNIHQNQIILKQLQAQQQLFQQQQQQRQFVEQHQQQQHPSENVPLSSQNQVLPQNTNVSTAAEPEKRILLRFPNPFRQQTQQQQQTIVNPTFSCSPVPMFHGHMSSPQLTHQEIQQHREMNTANPGQQQRNVQQPLKQNPIIVDLMDDEEEDTPETEGQMPSQTRSPAEGCSSSAVLTSHEKPTQMHHSQISRKAQCAAADSTVNAGNGSSEDSSASPCPSTSSVPKRSAPPIGVSEPPPKQMAIENSHTILGNKIDTEGATRSPLISTTMEPGDDFSQPQVMAGSTNGQIEISAIERPDHTHQEDVYVTTKHNDDQQSTSSKCQNDGLMAEMSEINDEKLHGDDRWDDYCYVCSQGCDETTGSLGCCETCTRVFHAKCHVPMILVAMEDLPDDWQCTLCMPGDPLTQISHSFGQLEKMLCSKVFLSCFADFFNVEPFLNAVSSDESDYYAVIKEPIWLNKIAQKISSSEYNLISEFIDDMNLLFRNCSTFNSPTNSLSASGKKVYTCYMKAMRKFLPVYEKQIWIYVSLYNTRLSAASLIEEESARKRGNRRGIGQKAKSQTPC